MNAEILECQKYLHPENPTDVTSEDIKPYLEVLGWKEGDKIPSGMQEYTSAVLRILNKPVNMRNLHFFFEDETVIATLKSAINKTNLYEQEQNNIANKVKDIIPNPEELHPDTRDAVMELAERAVKEEIEEAAKEQVTDIQLDGFSDVDTTEEVADESDAEEDIEELKKHQLCPRCMWDMAEPYEPYPVTDDDKLAYAYSILGGTEFKKSYTVANGLLEITYRMPTAHIARMIEDQVKIDGTKGRLYDSYQFYVNNNRYGLAASLVSVKALKGVDKNPPIPDINDKKFRSEYDDTPIYKFTEYIEENIIKSGVRERYFRDTYNNFINLNLHLMHTIDNENFSEEVLDKLS